MRVKMDFEQMYRTQSDPWGIGEADSERYDLYYEELLRAARRRGTILDIGCGMGAFLARFRGDFDDLMGVEVSAEGVAKGGARFPFIELVQGSAYELDQVLDPDARYDAIIFSDVINYFTEAQKRRALAWIADHLTDDGVALVAAYSPGGRYLDRDELKRLVGHHLAIEQEQALETQHVALICRLKRSLVAITVDHETWQPIPEGETIDWEADVFEPTSRLLDACDAEGVPLTLMAEMGEYFWLRENEPSLAERMEEQWREAARRGHDVQLHLHPNWLPELGARREADGSWSWDDAKARAHDYPGDLDELIRRCKEQLEATLRTVAPEHAVTCFRAGAYEAQPFSRLHDALVANGIACDSSVLPGDRREGRSYDYTLAYSDHQPYFPSRHDPQLKAPPAERSIVELPAFAPEPGRRWTFDGPEASRFAEQLLRHHLAAQRLPTTASRRRRHRFRGWFGHLYWRLRRWRRFVNRLIPRRLAHLITDYEPEKLVGHDYYVMVAHSKAELDFDAIGRGLRELRNHGFEFVTLSDMAGEARAELSRTVGGSSAEEGGRERGDPAMMGSQLNRVHPDVLQSMIPLDRHRLLEVASDAGTSSAGIPDLYPWIEVRPEHLSSVSLNDGTIDSIYAENALAYVLDVDRTLGELHRALTKGGVLIAAIPPDAYRPDRVCENHTWRTAPGETADRLRAAGFERISLRELDAYRELGAAPYPPSADRMMYLQAWKAPPTVFERVRELTSWAYRALDPERPQDSDRPLEILTDGHAWCWGYVLVLAEALRREGVPRRFVTMLADDHPRGRGRRRRDSHEVLEVELPTGAAVVCDPMTGTVFEASVEELLHEPPRADGVAQPDERWHERGYELYATSAWYSRVVSVAVRERADQRPRFRKVHRRLRA